MSNSELFIFNQQLDAQYLHDFYQGDIDRTILMFDVFIKVTGAEVEKLGQFLEEENWDGFSGQAHKIKPNFMMVGLSGMSETMKRFEGVKVDQDLRKLISLQYNDFKNDFADSKSIVVEELERLKEFSKL